MTVRVVYDTNVIVSAALKSGSIPASIVALALDQRVQLCLSPPIIREYGDVLHRPKFGFEASRVETFLKALTQASLIVHPTVGLEVASDPADNRFLECARDAEVDFLVTGNLRHFPLTEFQGIRIVEPSRFAQALADMLLE
jgi:putative PIN family toxin of toxin-antitoxin system